MNIASGVILENDEEEFLMNCISLGKAARNKFYESRLTEKDIRLLETIPKTRKSTKKNVEKKEHDWLKKHLNFDYARLRDFDLKILMGCEISTTCFYLTKRGLIRKPNKSELNRTIITHLPPADYHRNVIMDFMSYARKVSIKYQNLKTYNDFFINLWSTLSFLFKSCNRVDIVFDVYKENSIKASE